MRLKVRVLIGGGFASSHEGPDGPLPVLGPHIGQSISFDGRPSAREDANPAPFLLY